MKFAHVNEYLMQCFDYVFAAKSAQLSQIVVNICGLTSAKNFPTADPWDSVDGGGQTV